MGLWIDKGGNCLVNAAEVMLEQVAEQAVGDPADGRQVEERLIGDLLSHGAAAPPGSNLPPGPGSA